MPTDTPFRVRVRRKASRDNVVQMNGRSVVRSMSEPNGPLVVMLEDLLAEARAGHLQGLGAACMYAEGFYSSRWVVNEQISGNEVVGAMSRLHLTYVHTWLFKD